MQMMMIQGACCLAVNITIVLLIMTVAEKWNCK